MTNEAGEKPGGEALPSAPDKTQEIDWEKIRARYEQGEEQVKAIAASIGWVGITLSRHAKSLGWKLRGAVAAPVLAIRKRGRAESTGETIRRLKDLLGDRIANLEAEIQAIGKDIDEMSNEKKLRNVTIGMGGYIGGRSLEKIAGQVVAGKK